MLACLSGRELMCLRFAAGFVSHIPIPALAGVTAWMGICLLDWSAWRRLMRRIDAAAFLVTAGAVLAVNAVAAVAIGSGLYAIRYLYQWRHASAGRVVEAN